MSDDRRFSERYGFRQDEEVEIVVREDAPFELRGVLIDLAYECGFGPSSLRELVCRVFRKRADQGNWSEYPNIDDEVRRLVDQADWYRVYDLIEAILANMAAVPFSFELEKFSTELNRYFAAEGIGWKVVEGKVEVRNPEVLERTLVVAAAVLEESDCVTAHRELHEALVDLSRRPCPDVTGAVQHSMAALECVAREVTGNRKATLGDILRRNADIIPRPLNLALEKMWGFASEYGRHIQEGRTPNFSEAQLVVGVCAAAVTYFVDRKATS